MNIFYVFRMKNVYLLEQQQWRIFLSLLTMLTISGLEYLFEVNMQIILTLFAIFITLYRYDMVQWVQHQNITTRSSLGCEVLNFQDIKTIIEKTYETHGSILILGKCLEGIQHLLGYCYCYREARESIEIVNYESINRTVNSKDCKTSDSLYIAELFISRNYRSEGFGGLLLFSALKSNLDCKNQMFAAHLFVSSRNGKAVAFYKRFGFRESNVLSEDQVHDSVLSLQYSIDSLMNIAGQWLSTWLRCPNGVRRIRARNKISSDLCSSEIAVQNQIFLSSVFVNSDKKAFTFRQVLKAPLDNECSNDVCSLHVGCKLGHVMQDSAQEYPKTQKNLCRQEHCSSPGSISGQEQSQDVRCNQAHMIGRLVSLPSPAQESNDSLIQESNDSLNPSCISHLDSANGLDLVSSEDLEPLPRNVTDLRQLDDLISMTRVDGTGGSIISRGENASEISSRGLMRPLDEFAICKEAQNIQIENVAMPASPAPLLRLRHVGRPINPQSKRQRQLAARAADLSPIMRGRGRPIDPSSNRQRLLRLRAEAREKANQCPDSLGYQTSDANRAYSKH